MKIFTPCWGTKHINLLKTALGRSLSWPRNLDAIRNAEWIFVSENVDERKEIIEIVKSISETIQTKFFLFSGIQSVDSGQALISPLKATIRACIEENEPLLMATPDFIYGNGTVANFKHMAKDRGSCVTIAHLRVVPKILNFLNNPLENHELMNWGLNYAHLSWTGCEADKLPNRIYHSGIRWTDLSRGLIAVQHYMPSPFFVNFLREDLEHFSIIDEGRPPGFGLWDHIWPTKLLEAGRLRFIGSSDAALMLEVTDSDKNVPPINEKNLDGFFRNHPHNRIQSQFISIFRRK